MFEFSQLRCFVAVAEQLHFGHAATQLNMTQPPLSRQIMLLEREVGAPLLERTSRSVKLTPAGRVFLPEARRILRLSESAVRWTQRVWRGEAGTLRIGFTAASGYGMLPDLMPRIRDAMPDVDIVLREMVTNAQVEALASGILDVGFVRPPVDLRQFASCTYLEEKFVVAVPRGGAFTEKSGVEVAALHDEPFIMYSPDVARYFHDLLTDLFDRERIRPKIIHQLGQIHSMLGLVDAGFGIALVPEAATRLSLAGVKYIPLLVKREVFARLEVIWRRENDNPALHAFISKLMSEDDR